MRRVSRAFITGLAGPSITAEERDFLRDAEPWGLILFKRNVETPEQVRRLTSDLREILAEVPILIDQEGGRVQRLGPPHWPVYPPGAAYGHVYDRNPARGIAAARLGARLIAADLHRLGIDVDCLPVADVPAADADQIIGDRAYGDTPAKVAALAGAAAAGPVEGGLLPVVKHLPGHGRATADSHHRLPVVGASRDTLDSTDFAAFRALAHLPLGMTAHVVFTALDPAAPATTSPIMIGDVIRQGIGFTGALMSDDVSMGALTGTIAERTRAAVAAGCDLVLHCNGQIDEMRAVAAATPRLDGAAAQRAAAALACRRTPAAFDEAKERARFAAMMAPSAGPVVS